MIVVVGTTVRNCYYYRHQRLLLCFFSGGFDGFFGVFKRVQG